MNNDLSPLQVLSEYGVDISLRYKNLPEQVKSRLQSPFHDYLLKSGYQWNNERLFYYKHGQIVIFIENDEGNFHIWFYGNFLKTFTRSMDVEFQSWVLNKSGKFIREYIKATGDPSIFNNTPIFIKKITGNDVHPSPDLEDPTDKLIYDLSRKAKIEGGLSSDLIIDLGKKAKKEQNTKLLNFLSKITPIDENKMNIKEIDFAHRSVEDILNEYDVIPFNNTFLRLLEQGNYGRSPYEKTILDYGYNWIENEQTYDKDEDQLIICSSDAERPIHIWYWDEGFVKILPTLQSLFKWISGLSEYKNSDNFISDYNNAEYRSGGSIYENKNKNGNTIKEYDLKLIIKKIVKEVLQLLSKKKKEELEEDGSASGATGTAVGNTTAAVSPYNTPFAFKRKNREEEQNIKEMTTTGLGTTGYNIPGAFSSKGGSVRGVEGSAKLGYTLTPIGKEDMERRGDRLY